MQQLGNASESLIGKPRLFTVGHSNHQPGAFFALLERHNIRALVDVRSIPSSGRYPHFKQRSLEELCRRRGVSYRHCPELGNKVGGIANLLRQPEGQAALAELAAAAVAVPAAATAYMCAEADWRDCHRQVISQQLLCEYGVITLHVRRDGTIEPHSADHVLPEHYGMAPNLVAAFRNSSVCCPDGEDCSIARDNTVEALSLSMSDLQMGGTQELAVHSASDDAPSAPLPPPDVDSGEAAVSTDADASKPRVRRWGKKR